MRSTRAGRKVIEILEQTREPLSLRELHERVQAELPATAYSTIFRIVERLETDGRVHRVDWRARGSRFEWAARPHHHHVVCAECGRSVDVDDRDLGFDARRIEARTGFRVRHHAIEVEGTCPDCQS